MKSRMWAVVLTLLCSVTLLGCKGKKSKSCIDADGDGYGVGEGCAVEDCDDEDPGVNPDETEVPYDGHDNDCDANTPDDDLDGDGYDLADDCDDEDPGSNPGETEVPYDGHDNDCDANTPDDDLDGDGYLNADDCDDSNPNVWVSCADCVDLDGDGYFVDCDAYDTVSGPDCDEGYATCTIDCTDTNGIPGPDCGQWTWMMVMGGDNNGDDWGSSVIQTSDGNLVAVGNIRHLPLGPPWIVKLDRYGQVIWQTTLDAGLSSFIPERVIEAANGDLVVVGSEGMLNNGDGRAARYTSDGVVLWNNTYGTADEETFRGVVETPDNGLCMVGVYVDVNHDHDMWVVKTDADGNIDWQQRLGGADDDYGISATLDNNGNILIAGSTESHTIFNDAWLVRLAVSDGAVLEQTAYGYVGGSDSAVRAVVSADGSVTLGGVGTNGTLYGFWITRLSPSGTVQWTKVLGGPDENRAWAMAEDPADGSLVMVGHVEPLGPNVPYAGVLKLSSAGDVLWQKYAGGGYVESAVDVVVTDYGAVVLVAISNSYPQGLTGNMMLMSLATDGVMNGTCSDLSDLTLTVEDGNLDVTTTTAVTVATTASASAMALGQGIPSTVTQVVCPE